MPISAADILIKRSVNTGPGNSTAQPAPGDSLGGFMSSTTIPDATANSVFDDVTGDENTALDVEFRCIFIHNAHASLTYRSVGVWLASETAGGANIALGIAGQGVVPSGSATAQADRVADENTTPPGETFSAPTTRATRIPIGDIPAGSCVGIWVRRTATNSPPLDVDNFQIGIGGDTSQ